MQKIFSVLFLLLLAGCGGSTTSNTAPVVQWVLANCGVIVDAAAVGAVTASGQPLAGAATGIVGNAICTAFKQHHSITALVGSCVQVNGVCVGGEVADQSKLDSFKPQ